MTMDVIMQLCYNIIKNKSEGGLMVPDKKTLYTMEQAKEKLKRIPLDVQKEKYQEIKTAAENVGESVNGYIKKAVDTRIESGK